MFKRIGAIILQALVSTGSFVVASMRQRCLSRILYKKLYKRKSGVIVRPMTKRQTEIAKKTPTVPKGIATDMRISEVRQNLRELFNQPDMIAVYSHDVLLGYLTPIKALEVNER